VGKSRGRTRQKLKERRKISIYSSFLKPHSNQLSKQNVHHRRSPRFHSRRLYNFRHHFLYSINHRLDRSLYYGSAPSSPGTLFITSPKTSSWPSEDDHHHNHHSILHPPLYLRRRRDLLPHIYRVAVHDRGEIYSSTVHFVDEMIVSHLDPSNRHNITWPHSPEK
jgi:hypothetical protein